MVNHKFSIEAQWLLSYSLYVIFDSCEVTSWGAISIDSVNECDSMILRRGSGDGEWGCSVLREQITGPLDRREIKDERNKTTRR